MPARLASTARASCMRIALAVICAAAVALAGSLPSPTADAASSIGLFPVAAGLAYPLFAGDAGDGSGRLFIVEQRGIIRIMQAGALRPIPFLDIRNIVLDDGSEQGLLGLAFHPSFASNGRFYVAYTALNGNDVVAEYRLSSDPNRGNPGSRRILINQPDPYPNHNGGNLAFGPDGYLYIGMGDGGSAGDPQGNGQKRSTLLGKILRIDVDGGTPYGIPPSNPFVGQAGVREEIWAYGLRNPWRFSFDKSGGDLYIGDVGQNSYEEIDFQARASTGGQNYGWNVMEGLHCYPPGTDTCDTSGKTLPVAEYGHDQGCSITGGYVYRGAEIPTLRGAYLYGDFCQGQLWTLTHAASGAWQQAPLLSTSLMVSSFGQDQAGELYLVRYRGGAVYRITGPLSANLVRNSDFETDTSGWQAVLGTLDRAGGGYQGDFAARVTASGCPACPSTRLDSATPVVANPQQGQRYYASVWVKGGAVGKTARLELQESGGGSATAVSRTADVMLTADWQLLWVSHTVAAAGRTRLDVSVRLNNTAAGDALLVDAVTVKRAS